MDRNQVSGYLSTSAKMRLSYGVENVPLTPMAKTLHKNFIQRGISVNELKEHIAELPADEQSVMNDVMSHLENFL